MIANECSGRLGMSFNFLIRRKFLLQKIMICLGLSIGACFETANKVYCPFLAIFRLRPLPALLGG